MVTSTHLALRLCHTIWIGCRARNKDRHGEGERRKESREGGKKRALGIKQIKVQLFIRVGFGLGFCPMQFSLFFPRLSNKLSA